MYSGCVFCTCIYSESSSNPDHSLSKVTLILLWSFSWFSIIETVNAQHWPIIELKQILEHAISGNSMRIVRFECCHRIRSRSAHVVY